MKQNKSTQILQATSIQQVNFRDGMIVTAEDLQDASTYPLDLFKTLIRAFFGCGIVCGLNVRLVEDNEKNNQSWYVEVKPGVALDCHGHPLELCKPVKIDLHEPYVCDPCPPDCVCIAIKRCTSEAVPRPNPGCGEDKNSKNCEPSRIREHVLIKVFDPEDYCERPKNICGLDPENIGCCDMHEKEYSVPKSSADPGAPRHEREDYCECMKACSCGKCCGDCWVLLACIKLNECGVECVHNGQRQYIKPIQCACQREQDECIEDKSPPDLPEKEKEYEEPKASASTSVPPSKKITKKRTKKVATRPG